MSILILGAAGYIGSHTALELIKRNKKVIAVDNLSTGHIELIPKEAVFYKGDIKDKAFLDNIFKKEKIEAVFHFAASSIVSESVANPLKYYENNVCATLNLLKVMIENNVNKIIFSSSAAVYGEPTQIPIKENAPLNPANPYGETKLIIENMLKYLDLTNQIKFVSLRYFNACGADFKSKIGEWHTPETHLIPLILDVALGKKEFISIFGDDYNTKDGTCIRDYIHVCDLAQAHILALDYLQNKGESEIFNLGSEEGYSVKEIIESAKRVCQKDIPIKIEKRRSGDPAILIADSSKAKELLNWERKYKNIDEIIKSAWMWHKINL